MMATHKFPMPTVSFDLTSSVVHDKCRLAVQAQERGLRGCESCCQWRSRMRSIGRCSPAFVVMAVLIWGMLQPSVSHGVAVAGAEANQIDLAYVATYASTSSDSVVVTFGTVAGVQATPTYQLVLSDGSGHYVLITFARAFTESLAPVLSTLRVGDIAEVTGTAGSVQGILVTSAAGVRIETIGVNLANAPTFGAMSVTTIQRIFR